VLRELQDSGEPQSRDGQLAPVCEPMRMALIHVSAEQPRPLVLAVFYSYTAPASRHPGIRH